MRKLLGAAALGCGILFCAWAVPDNLPAAGPLRATTMQRLLLVDAERFGKRIVAVGAYGAYYESVDKGATWSARKIIADDKHLNAILELGAGNLLILGETGTILTSGDWGKSWTPNPSPYKGSFFGAVVTDDGAVVAFGMRGRIYRSADKGKTWKQVDNASTATLIGAEKLPDGSVIIAGSAGTALVSRDNGQSFVPITTGTTKAFSKPVLGAENSILLLGEAGAREVKLPVARK